MKVWLRFLGFLLLLSGIFANRVNFALSSRRRLSNNNVGYREYSFVRREGDGVYYANITIGTPPQYFTAIVDTGSATIAVPCKGCNCGDHNHYDISRSKSAVRTKSNYRQCYSEGSCNEGKVINDLICIGEVCNEESTVKHGFGCCDRFARAFQRQEADGIIGFSGGENTLIADLRKHHKLENDIFSICLGINGGGVSVGGGMAEKHLEAPQYMPLQKSVYYTVKLEGIAIGGSFKRFNGINPIIDTGTTFTYAPSTVQGVIREQIAAHCDNSNNKCLGSPDPVNTPAVDTKESAGCFSKPGEMDYALFARSYPPIEVELSGGKRICWPPMGYFYEAKHNIYCIGVMKESSRTKMVLGANILTGFDVIFDHEAKRIGFARSICDEPEDVGVSASNYSDVGEMRKFYIQNSCCGTCAKANKGLYPLEKSLETKTSSRTHPIEEEVSEYSAEENISGTEGESHDEGSSIPTHIAFNPHQEEDATSKSEFTFGNKRFLILAGLGILCGGVTFLACCAGYQRTRSPYEQIL